MSQMIPITLVAIQIILAAVVVVVLNADKLKIYMLKITKNCHRELLFI